MYQANITRAEAKDRSSRISAEAYEVTVDLSGRMPDGSPVADPTGTFVSSSTVHFHSRGGGDAVNIIAREILAVNLDGEALDPGCYTDYRVPFSVAAGEHTLTVVALCEYSRTGEGLHRFVDPADDRVYLYTQFETADARRMFANFEQPDQKATFQFTVIAPEQWTVCSNSPTPAPTAALDGFARWEFAPTPRISSYITALVAGEYDRVDDVYEGPHGTIPLGLLCRKSQREHLDVDRLLEVTRRGFEIFEEAFAYPYPFGKYDQCFVPEFNAGAMENAGCVTHRDDYLFRSRQTATAYESRDNTILHEMCHMWFGDLVTMKWWDDLWLNESFAEWGSHFCQAKIAERWHTGVDAWAAFCNVRKGWAYRQDQMPTTHPIAADMVDLEAVELNFDGITYAKGASTLRQLVAFVGEEAFLTGLKQYFKDHAFGNTELTDLLRALEKASGRDLSWFSEMWLAKAGVNTLTPRFEVDAEGTFTSFAIEQTAPDEWPTLRRHRLAIGLYDMVDGRLTRVHRVETEIDGPRTDIAELIGKHRGRLVLVNDDDLTYAKIRLDEDSLHTLTQHVAVLDSRLARALCWGAAWDMTRDGEMRPQDYLTLVLAGAVRETDSSALAAVTLQAVQALTTFVPPELRAAERERLTAGLTELVHTAEPGSDNQLLFAIRLAAVAGDAGTGAVLRGWLDGRDVPAGLVVDTDLRWKLLRGLARMGLADGALIDAELARDTTITGQENASAARAAMPTPEAKAEAWRRAAEDTATPNETQRAISLEFGHPDQAEVLAPYVDKYLELAEQISSKSGIWATRSQQVAHVCLTLLFPADATPRTLERLDAWLAGRELSDQVSRLVTERRDALVRALRCQEAAR